MSVTAQRNKSVVNKSVSSVPPSSFLDATRDVGGCAPLSTDSSLEEQATSYEGTMGKGKTVNVMNRIAREFKEDMVDIKVQNAVANERREKEDALKQVEMLKAQMQGGL